MQKAERSEVKYKVRRTALLLKQFTVNDIVRLTGLNISSVRTELQRMKKEGYILSQSSGKGSIPTSYELADDSEKRVELAQSVSAFEALPEGDGRPTTPFYEITQRLLDRAQVAEAEERKHLLPEAEDALEIAEAAEGDSLASASVQAHLQYERARLLSLRNEPRELSQLVETIEAIRLQFEQLGHQGMSERAGNLLLCVKHQKRTADRQTENPEAAARAFLKSLRDNEYQPEDPVAAALIQLLQATSQTADDKILDIANELAEIKGALASQASLIEDGHQKVVSEIKRDRELILTRSVTKERSRGAIQKTPIWQPGRYSQ